MKFCGEIQYTLPGVGSVHSDICHACVAPDQGPELDDDHRVLLHRYLDEWLDNSGGAGFFWVGDRGSIVDNFAD